MAIRYTGITFLAALLSMTAAFSNQLNLSDSIPALAQEKNISSQLLLPASLFLAGTAVSSVKGLKRLEIAVYNGFRADRKHTPADDYLQYAPALAVFAADAIGVKGKNKPKQQLFIYGLSTLGTAAVVQSMKRIIGRERPDGSDRRSFPSGHTSTAFVAAELLHQEFGKHSPWISISGYTAATATGYLRMYNNAHWLGDVLAGAAIGMGTTRLVYWIKEGHSRKKKENDFMRL